MNVPLSLPNNQLEACVTSTATAITKIKNKIDEALRNILLSGNGRLIAGTDDEG